MFGKTLYLCVKTIKNNVLFLSQIEIQTPDLRKKKFVVKPLKCVENCTFISKKKFKPLILKKIWLVRLQKLCGNNQKLNVYKPQPYQI